MENDNSMKIFQTKTKVDINQASEYLEECNITCTVKKSGQSEYELWVAENDKEKALSLLEDILPAYFTSEEEDSGQEEEGEEEDLEAVKKESNILLLGILGKVILAGSIIAAVLGLFIPIPYIKLITGVLAGVGIILNGYEGFKTQKTLPILLCLLSVVVLVVGIFFTRVKTTPNSKPVSNPNSSSLARVMSSAGNQLTNKNYNEAITLYEEALKIAIAENNSPGEILTLSFLGAIYDQKSQLEKSLEYYNKALKRSEDTGNTSLGEIIRPEIDRISKLLDKSLIIKDGTQDAPAQ